MKIATKEQAAARYNELYEEHMGLLSPCDQSEIDRAAQIQHEQAELEREFPGTLEAWYRNNSNKL